MINIDSNLSQPNLQEEFAYRQIGSITVQIDPIDVSSPIEYIINYFHENPTHTALPIERNGVLIGILDRATIEKMNVSLWARFWQKDLDAYIHTPLLSLRADDYTEKNIVKASELNTETGARFFAVYYRRSFFGIVGLREMLTRVTDLRSRDMAKAHVVQQHLLAPGTQKNDPRYRMLTFNRMANEVGGDFYKDFAIEDGERHLVGCFDVSGKNVAASLTTMAIGSFFTSLKHFGLGEKFGEKTTILLDKYVEDLTPNDIFITAALCYIDLREKTVIIQNCGHTPIYIFIPGEGGKIIGKTMNPNLPPLGMGILETEENSGYRLPITKGLRIVLYTDGITDMVTPDGVRFDDNRTRELFASTYGKSETEAMDMYGRAIENWIAEAMLPDDVTIMDIHFLM